MEIDYYDEDFCKSDIENTNDLDELESMRTDLQSQIWTNEERNDVMKANIRIIQERVQEIKK